MPGVGERSVSLVSMPWHMLGFPSIQLGTLQGVLQRAGVPCQSHSFFLELLHFFSRHPRVGLDIDPYGEICGRWSGVGAGEWIFAVPPVRAPSKTRDERYVSLCKANGMPTRLIRTLRRVRELVPAFLEHCADEVLRAQPSVVGFTSAYSQTLPSVALARVLKSRDPDLEIVFGGSSCQGPMGAALLAAFEPIDVVVRGEAESSLVELVESLMSGAPVPRLAGLCFRAGEELVVVPGRAPAVAMDDVPVPVFDEYFERLAGTGLSSRVLPQVPFESSRGCWWGMKSHCTFCGVNGSDMEFRSKSPERVLELVSTLARRYGVLDFSAVDAILDMRYFETLFPRLVERGEDLSFFFETKANLSEPQVSSLRAAGVTAITPGIESLSTPTLRAMNKGVTALQNIRLLKLCAQRGIRVAWTLLYGFPGELPEEYQRMAELVPSLVHLPAPLLGSLQMYRFSPYFERPGDYGLCISRPLPHYGLLYDVDARTLADLAQAFEYTHEDGRDPELYVDPLRKQVARWNRDSSRNRGALSYRRGPGLVVVTDTRTTTEPARYTLEGAEAAAYLACDMGATPRSIAAELRAAPGPGLSEVELEGLLRGFLDARLVYEEDGRYLSLALPNAA